MTCGGGMDWAPIAWRTSARTIMMRMKQVVMSMIDGTRVITVSRIMMLSATESPPSSERPAWPGTIAAASESTRTGFGRSNEVWARCMKSALVGVGGPSGWAIADDAIDSSSAEMRQSKRVTHRPPRASRRGADGVG